MEMGEGLALWRSARCSVTRRIGMKGTYRPLALAAAVLACSILVFLPTNIHAQTYSAGSSTASCSELEQAVAANPADTYAWLSLARNYAQQQRWEHAVQAYQQLLTMGPVGRDVRLEYGDALRATGQLEAAVEQYNLAVETSHVDDLISRAGIALHQGQISDAAKLYEEALSADPTNSNALLGLARVYAEQQYWSEAVSLYDRLTRSGPVSQAVRLEYGDALRQTGDLERAVQQYNLAIASETAPTVPIAPATPAQSPATYELTPAPSFSPVAAATPTQIVTPSPPAEVVQADKPVLEVMQPVDLPRSTAREIPSQPVITLTPASTSLSTPQSSNAAAGSFYLERDTSEIQLFHELGYPTDSTRPFISTTASEQPAGNATPSELLQQAREHVEAKEWEDAVLAFEQLIALEPIDLDVRLEYADALREAGQLQKAQEQFNRVLHSEPDSVDARIGLAKTLALAGNLDEAMYLLDQVYMEPSAFRRARLARAYAYLVNGYVEEARSDLGDLLASTPGYEDVVEMIRNVEPWEDIRAILASRPGNEELIELIDEIVQIERSFWLQQYGEPSTAAERYFQAGDTESAKAAYEEMVRTNPQDAVAWLRLATMYRWDGQWVAAIEAYEYYFRLVDYDLEAQLRYGQVLLWGGYAEAAVDVLQSLITDSDTPVEIYEQALMAYATALNTLGASEKALYWYRKALVFEPRSAEIRTAYAACLAGLRRYKEALNEYCTVLRFEADYDAARIGLAQVHAWRGELTEAMKIYDQIDCRSEYYAVSRIGKAYCHLWAGEHLAARRLADEAARLDPQHADLAALYDQLNTAPGPSLRAGWRQSHDSDDNDYTGTTARFNIPLKADGTALTIEHEEFYLDNSTLEEETDGKRTRLEGELHLNDQVTLRGHTEFVELDNTFAAATTGVSQEPTPPDTTPTTPTPPDERWTDVEFWNYGGSVDVAISDKAAAYGGYASYTLCETPRMAQTAVTVDEGTVRADYEVYDDTIMTAQYAWADLSDGNQRDAWWLNARRTTSKRNVGTMTYGLSYRTLDYDQDLNNGYWDPSNYRYAEAYINWLDQSKRPVLLDGGLGYGYDKADGQKTRPVFHYHFGLRAPLLNEALLIRAGYASSDAATSATTGPGYEHESWYFDAQYSF